MHRKRQSIFFISASTLVGAFSSSAMAKDASSNELRCAGWSLADHSSPIAFRLGCTEVLVATGKISSIPDSTLVTENAYYLQEAAKTGEPMNAEMVRMLTEAREKRLDRIWSHRDDYYTALLMVGDVNAAMQERERKNLRVPAVDLTNVASTQKNMVSHSIYWSFDPKGRLTPGVAQLEEGPHIVVYTLPGCGRCQAAAKELSTDPELLSRFRDNSIWINVPDSNFESEYYSEWNVLHPDLPVHAIFSRAGWPQWKIPGAPYFFFLRDGRVVSEMLGWTKDSKRELSAHLRDLGLQ